DRTEKHREENSRPAEKSSDHSEQPDVAEADALAPAHQLIKIAGAEQDAAAEKNSQQRTLPADLRHHQSRGDEADQSAGPGDDIRNQAPVVVDDRDDPQRRAEHEARDRVGQREREVKIEGDDSQAEFGEKMAERNRRAAHHAAPAQSEVGENRDVRPPRDRALATLAIRARRHDRKIARQAVGDHADEAAYARAQEESEGGADSGGDVQSHRVTITYAASSLSGAEVNRQIVSALDAAIQIVDRQALVVAVDARNFSLTENHRDESVCGHALG